MAIEIVGSKDSDIRRYREVLHKRGEYTKRYKKADESGLYLEKPDDYQQRFGTLKMVKSVGDKGQIEKDTEDRLSIVGIANANMVDRMDERLEPSGVDTTAFDTNRVLLVDHMYFTRAVVGKVENITPEHDGVKFEAYVGDPKEAVLTDVQRDTRSLIKQGLLQTVSVGFIPHKIQAPTFDDEGKLVDPAVILAWELLELSIVAVPANAGSTFEMRNYAKKFFAFNDSNEGSEKGLTTPSSDTQTIKELKQSDTEKVHTLSFAKDTFNLDESKDWTKQHEFKSDSYAETADAFIFQQRELGDFEDGSFKTSEVETGIKATIGRLKTKGTDDMTDEQLKELKEAIAGVAKSVNDHTSEVLKTLKAKGDDEDKEEDEDEDEEKKALKTLVDSIKTQVDAQAEQIKTLAECVQKFVDANG